ncbi:hypothetical protein CYMTET_26703 [Cymbomonas tetramitiformis]|uniref:Uncharacterized protein n=1 Tax=Cymbomonas tetramitiformis TaxID=36881 RepID=A0AAE0FR97_9CHLO|nr:hypothetical protein CYMTET_26703 [Cymbomonas tetramitiformis]
MIISMSLVAGIILVPRRTEHDIRKKLVVSGSDSSSWPLFVSDHPNRSTVQKNMLEDLSKGRRIRYTFFNLTNPYEVVHDGAKPFYKEVGKYVYTKYVTRLGIDFHDEASGAQSVTFKEWPELEFLPEESKDSSGAQRSEDDIIWNIDKDCETRGVEEGVCRSARLGV